MGIYSWKYCDSPDRMICGKMKDSYLLIPAEFGGGAYRTPIYSGYGRIQVDIFEMVAKWNQKHITADHIIPPNRADYIDALCGEQYYQSAMSNYNYYVKRLSDFISGKSDEYMVKAYGTEYIREIGINIAHDEEDNARLKYPIKIAEYATSVYEECDISILDPLQGCY